MRENTNRKYKRINKILLIINMTLKLKFPVKYYLTEEKT